jgi:CRISPR/Cas system-associated protein endoribonuclease Cas2
MINSFNDKYLYQNYNIIKLYYKIIKHSSKAYQCISLKDNNSNKGIVSNLILTNKKAYNKQPNIT